MLTKVFLITLHWKSITKHHFLKYIYIYILLYIQTKAHRRLLPILNLCYAAQVNPKCKYREARRLKREND